MTFDEWDEVFGLSDAPVKTCRACKEKKDPSEYAAHKHGKNGLRAICRSCMNARYRRWARRTKKPLEACRRYRKAHPDKTKARQVKMNASQREQRKLNPERFREIDRKRYAVHAEKRAMAAQARRDRDRDAYNAQIRAARARNPEKHKMAHHNRRLRVVGLVRASEIKAQYDSQGGHCYYCWKSIPRTGRDCHVDHLTALVAGGLNEVSNIVMACGKCNLRKGVMDGFAFFRKIGIQVEPTRKVA